MSQKVASFKKVADVLTMKLEAERCAGDVDTMFLMMLVLDVMRN